MPTAEKRKTSNNDLEIALAGLVIRTAFHSLSVGIFIQDRSAFTSPVNRGVLEALRKSIQRGKTCVPANAEPGAI